jgi:hypothetical protein
MRPRALRSIPNTSLDTARTGHHMDSRTGLVQSRVFEPQWWNSANPGAKPSRSPRVCSMKTHDDSGRAVLVVPVRAVVESDARDAVLAVLVQPLGGPQQRPSFVLRGHVQFRVVRIGLQEANGLSKQRRWGLVWRTHRPEPTLDRLVCFEHSSTDVRSATATNSFSITRAVSSSAISAISSCSAASIRARSHSPPNCHTLSFLNLGQSEVVQLACEAPRRRSRRPAARLRCLSSARRRSATSRSPILSARMRTVRV